MYLMVVRLFGADILVSLPHSSTPPSSSPKAEILDSSNVKAHTTDQIRLVPKMNFCVEPMHFGTVLFGKPWCSKQAIYSKGFTGRVKFFSVHDPTQVCYYISEVLDAGLLEPLFKVTSERCPSGTSASVSPEKYWKMMQNPEFHCLLTSPVKTRALTTMSNEELICSRKWP